MGFARYLLRFRARRASVFQGLEIDMTTRQAYSDFLKRLKMEPPVECEFSVGDIVTFTNEYGVSFPGNKVIGFAADDEFYGRFIHLDKEAWWFPVRPAELTLECKASESR